MVLYGDFTVSRRPGPDREVTSFSFLPAFMLTRDKFLFCHYACLQHKNN